MNDLKAQLSHIWESGHDNPFSNLYAYHRRIEAHMWGLKLGFTDQKLPFFYTPASDFCRKCDKPYTKALNGLSMHGTVEEFILCCTVQAVMNE